MSMDYPEHSASTEATEQDIVGSNNDPRELGHSASHLVIDTAKEDSPKVISEAVLPNYELEGPVADRMASFLDSLSQEAFASTLDKSDAIAVTEAINEIVNGVWSEKKGAPDQRFDESKFKALLFRMLIGFTNPEISQLEGVSLGAVESSIKRIKARIREKAKNEDVDFKTAIVKKVKEFRQNEDLVNLAEIENMTAYGFAELPKPRDERMPDQSRKRQERRERQRERLAQEGLSLPKQIRRTKQKPKAETKPREKPSVDRRPSPAAMPRVIHEPAISLYEKYKDASSFNSYPEDHECPEFTTLWSTRTLSMLYDAFVRDGIATVIRERVDGTDKRRRPEKDVVTAMGRLRRVAKRAKVEFENELQIKSFDMLVTPAENGGFNTLGDIIREIRSEYPELQDSDVAALLVGSINDVLSENAKVLVIER